MNLSSIEQGELVVADVLFAEQTETKRRLVLVVSNSDYNKKSLDLVGLKVTSQQHQTGFDVFLSRSDTEKQLLKKDSTVMTDFLVTLAKQTIVSRADKVKPGKLEEVKNGLKKLFDLE